MSNKTTNVDGAQLTPAIIEQLKDWQREDGLCCSLDAIDGAIGAILDLTITSELSSEESKNYFQLISNLRFLSRNLSTFQIKQ